MNEAEKVAGRTTVVPYLLVDQGRNRKAIKAVGERLPEPDVVSTLAFIIEAIYAVDGSTFMIASEQEEVLRIFDLHHREGIFSLVPHHPTAAASAAHTGTFLEFDAWIKDQLIAVGIP